MDRRVFFCIICMLHIPFISLSLVGLKMNWLQAGLLAQGSSSSSPSRFPSGFFKDFSPHTAAGPHRTFTCFPIMPAILPATCCYYIKLYNSEIISFYYSIYYKYFDVFCIFLSSFLIFYADSPAIIALPLKQASSSRKAWILL